MEKRIKCGLVVLFGVSVLQTALTWKACYDERKAKRRAERAELGEAIYKLGYVVDEVRIKHLEEELEKVKSN